MTGPQAAMLGQRLHLQHGPIDLIIQAWGANEAVETAYHRATTAFDGVLEGLVADLPRLRNETFRGPASSPVASRMITAITPHKCFVTPMAAVAGAVADHILEAMLPQGHFLNKAMVNNGGDIALWLSVGQNATVGLTDHRKENATVWPVDIKQRDRIGGIATSGWRGRSHSLGIADFVTVFAESAASADVAATLIANAVDVPNSAKVMRQSAYELSPDSDLGERLVTVDVAKLERLEVQSALQNGLHVAEEMIKRGLIAGAALGLQGDTVSADRGRALIEVPMVVLAVQ